MKNIDKLQNLLPLGYLFLIILGIAKESIFYYQIGINIVKYSSIMDILISPVAAITSHPVFFVTVLLLFIFSFKLPQILLKNEDKKGLHKVFGSKITKTEKNKNEVPEKERIDYYNKVAIEFLCMFLISVFLGYGFADGRATSEKIRTNKISYDYKLNYNDNRSENIYLIGSNTTYYFYLTEGSPIVKIAPVNSIRNLELTKNRMLNK